MCRATVRGLTSAAELSRFDLRLSRQNSALLAASANVLPMVDALTQEFVKVFQTGGISGEPCDEWQVLDIEQQLRVQLPPAYKAFLLLAGQAFGPFEGAHYALEDDLADIQRSARRILQRDHADLPSEAFVFFVHQGVAVRFFTLNSGEDPAVFEYVQGWPPVKQVALRFSDFLLQEVRESKSRPG